MTWRIIELLFPALLIVLPWALYGSRRPRMAKFHLRMVSSERTRRLYVRSMLVLLLLYHYIYVSGHVGEWGVIPSTMLSAVLISFSLSDGLLRKLNADRKTCMPVGLMAVAIAMLPHLYTVGIVLAFLLLAAMFYPSDRVLAQWRDKEGRKRLKEDPDALSELYYLDHHACRREYVDSVGETESTNSQTKKQQK